VVDGVLSALVDVASAVVSLIAETTVRLLVASIKPWRYLLSPQYRSSFDAQWKGRSTVAKWFALLWGCFTLIASLIIVMAILWLALPMRESTPPQHHRVVEAVHSALQHLKHQRKDQ
jgi:hypothetical protein